MPEEWEQEEERHKPGGKGPAWQWAGGAWVLLPWGAALWYLPLTPVLQVLVTVTALLAAPVPVVLLMHRKYVRLTADVSDAEESLEQLKLQLDADRSRTARLREELQAANRQAQLTHQLALLGQFTAGFMHEFNNPLAIVAGRIEVLLDERREDPSLCADLEQMMKETRYMSRIATTLLQALRRERGAEMFEPSSPLEALEEAAAAMLPTARAKGIELTEEYGDAPLVDVPDHVVGEVVRGLLANALQALEGQERGSIQVRLEPFRAAGAKVVVRVEDNGPGVPEGIREHLFEPFISDSSGRERLGLGLFLAASLLDMYDGRIRYENRVGGGASFIIELPPARFTRGQPYHWFAGGAAD